MRTILLLALLMLSGCGTRKRNLKESESKFNFESSADSSVSFVKALELQRAALIRKDIAIKARTISYQGAAGDSASVKEFGPDGKLFRETKFKGSGKIHVGDNTTTDKSESSLSEVMSQHERFSSAGSEKVTASGSEKNKELHVKSNKALIPWWLWLLLIIGMFLLYWLNKRFKWIGLAKKHVLMDEDTENNFAKNTST